jgi:hypothetical protein
MAEFSRANDGADADSCEDPVFTLLNVLIFLVLAGWILSWDSSSPDRPREPDLDVIQCDEHARVRALLRELEPSRPSRTPTLRRKHRPIFVKS